MCIGIPMRVKQAGFGYATCEGMGRTREVDTLLVGEQPPGTWLLVFINSAREVLSETEAKKITDAVTAVDSLMQQPGQMPGEQLDHLFADLVNREPPKPPSLLELEQQQLAEARSGNQGEKDDFTANR